MDNKKRLREYLKSYRIWQAQARDIEKAIAKGEVPSLLHCELIKAKEDFIRKCHNIQVILGYAKNELERRVLNLRYVNGIGMKQVARELGYSYGYCVNIEFNTIVRMSNDARIMQLLS